MAYYYNLSSIAIDYLKEWHRSVSWAGDSIRSQGTSSKMHLITSLISMRKQGDDEKYNLDQNTYLITLDRNLRQPSPSPTIRHNNRSRVYGLIITKERNRGIYEKLIEGVTSRRQLHDPSLYWVNKRQYNMESIFK